MSRREDTPNAAELDRLHDPRPGIVSARGSQEPDASGVLDDPTRALVRDDLAQHQTAASLNVAEGQRSEATVASQSTDREGSEMPATEPPRADDRGDARRGLPEAEPG
jgi:hypothetical protein